MPSRRSRLLLPVVAAALVAAALPLALPLDAHAAHAADDAAFKGRLIVLWKADAPALDTATLQTVSRSKGGHRSVVKVAKGHSAAVAAAQLRADPRVAAVLPDVEMTATDWPTTDPNDTYYAGYQHDLPAIGVPAAWKLTTGSQAITVAVLDTGLYAGHSEFAAAQIVSPRNEITNTSDPADGHGHGTHVSGTIMAATNNGSGIAGIAPGVSLMPVKVLSDSGSGSFADILDGIDWARTHGANVVSMSLGGGMSTDYAATVQPIIDSAWNAGVTLVAAAGNAAQSGNPVSYPCAFNHVICVAATDDAGVRASFSTYNEYVDISAPGVNTMSTLRTGGWGGMSGTSMATPHVAAVAALMLSAKPDATPSQVEGAIETTAVDLETAGRDDHTGWGFIQADDAILAITSGNPPAPPTGPPPAFTAAPAASPTTISYDGNNYCPTAVASTTVTVRTGLSSSTVGATASVSLGYTRPDGSKGSVAMTKGTATTTYVPWTGVISTVADRSIRTAGTLAYVATAKTGMGITKASATGSIAVKVCANTPPVITAPVLPTNLATNPLGTGTVPSGRVTSFTFSVPVSDTDGVAGVSLTLSGAGLATALVLPMTGSGSTWSKAVNLSSSGVQGGALAWKVTATDALGVAAVKSGTLTVVRADTAGSSSIVSAVPVAGGLTVTATADDPDALFSDTKTTLTAKVAWYATYTSSAGVATTSATTTTALAWSTGHTFAVTLKPAWLTTAVTNVRFVLAPTTVDAYGGTTAGTPLTKAVVPVGAPVIVSATSPQTAVYTDPLSTGNTSVFGGLGHRLEISADIRDTDGVSAVAVVTGPGLATPVTVPLVKGASLYGGSLDISTSGITGTGSVSWTVVATDVTGLITKSAAKTVSVTRADTAGTVAVASAALDSSGNVLVTVSGSDPDGTAAATTNMTAAVKWTGVAGTKTWALTTTSAAYQGSGRWVAKLAVGTYLLAAGSGTFDVTPTLTDPYKAITTGPKVQLHYPS